MKINKRLLQLNFLFIGLFLISDIALSVTVVNSKSDAKIDHISTVIFKAHEAEAAGKFGKALGLLKAATVASPHNLEVALHRVRLLAKLSRVDQALALLQKYDASKPIDTKLVLDTCRELIATQNPIALNAAIDLLRSSIKANPDDLTTRFALVKALAHQNSFTDALNELENLERLSPGRTLSYELRGNILYQIGDYHGAVLALDQVLSKVPNYVQGKLSRGDALLASGQIKEAALQYIKTTQEHPKSAVAWAKLGNFYQLRNSSKEAESAYRKSLTLIPQQAMVLNNLAQIVGIKVERLSEAIKLSSQAVQLAPNVALYRVTHGWLLMQSGSYVDAIKELKYGTELAPEYPVMWRHLSNAYRLNGQIENAKATEAHRLKLIK